MPSDKRQPDPDTKSQKMTAASAARCREFMARIAIAEKAIKKRLEKPHEKKKMAWHDRFDKSLEKMWEQMRMIERNGKEIETDLKRMALARKKNRARSGRLHRPSTS